MMKPVLPAGLITLFSLCLNACGSGSGKNSTAPPAAADTISTTDSQTLVLPAPYETKSAVTFSDVIGWPADKKPTAPAGFTVTRFASGFDNPRWIYVAKNGDIFIAESNTISSGIKKAENKIAGKEKSDRNTGSANRITLLRDTNQDGIPDLQTVFLTGLNQPFGMLIIGHTFYVGNTDGIMAFPYSYGQTKITAPGKKIVILPAGGYNNHWTRNLITNADSSKLYITVGSGSNAGEHGAANEVRRANILECNPDGSGQRIYASGLRNPQGMGWAPGTNTLWTSVNERDGLGDDLVPDYMTSVKDGGFYGWPYSYWGQHEDPRLKDQQRPDLVKQARTPDVSLNAHTASLGLAFDSKNRFPGRYSGGAFIGQHGSWNRSVLSGYQVAFVPFKDGQVAGPVEPFLTGFIADSAAKKVYGRPVGVAFTASGALLVADDASNTLWMVTAKRP